MKGKLGLVVGLTAGYVLGTRAGRERYEQIASAASKIWQTAPVQKQVDKAKGFAKSSALALPGAVWDTAVKVIKSASSEKTPGGKLDEAIAQTKKAAPAVSRAAEESAEAIGDAVDEAAKKVAAKKPATKKPAAKKPATAKSTRTTKKD